MRRRLVAVALATTSLVAVAFAVPLALLARNVARDRALTTAERDVAALAPVLALTTDANLIGAAIAALSYRFVFAPPSDLAPARPVSPEP